MTTSEAARHARAELETIAAGLQLHELALLVELARRMLDDGEAGAASSRPPSLWTCEERAGWT